MTSYWKSISLLLVLTVCTLPAYSETQWSTKDAEEEEEDELNLVAGNESFKSTTAPVEFKNSSSTEEINSTEDDLSWYPDSNYTEHELLLRTANSKESSLENGIERESEDDILPSLVVDARSFQAISPSPSMEDSSSFILESQLFTSQMSSMAVTESSCASEEDKCDLYRISSVKLEDRYLHSTTVPDSSAAMWNIVKQMRSRDDFSSRSTSEMPNDTSVAPTSQSSSAQTSEDLILVERTSDAKDDALLLHGNQSVKGEKTKSAKSGGIPADSERPFRTLSKIEMTSLNTESEKDPIAVSSTIDSFSTSSTAASPDGTSPFVEAEYIIAISDKIITPSVEYVYYVNQTGSPEKGKSSEIRETAPRISASMSESVSVSTGIDFAGVQTTGSSSTPYLLPSFTETYRLLELTSKASSSFTSGEDKSSLTSSVDQGVTASIPPVREYQGNSLLPKTMSTTDDELAPPPPRLTNPGCSSLPVCVEVTLLQTTWDKFCLQAFEFQQFLAGAVSRYTRPVHPHQIVLDALPCVEAYSVRPDRVSLAFYVTDDSGEYEESMTEVCGVILRKRSPTAFKDSVLEVRLFVKEELPPVSLPAHPVLPEVNSGFVAAVTISSVAGVALCLLCVLLVVVKQRFLQSRGPPARASPSDDYSLDSLSINASFRRRRVRRSARSYLNHAFSDQEIASHPLNEKNLMNCLKDKRFLEEEFKTIPMETAKLDQIPEGADVKNRYSNVLPKPETRVILSEASGDPLKSYINANYVKGYDGKASCYIACQAPLPEGMEDFWKMIWEQQSRVIIMLTMFEENGVSRCAPYFPQSTLVTLPPFGDFQISLLKKEVYEFYTMSTFRLFDLERNLFREITHLWYMTWPAVGVPNDPSSLVTFLLQCRPFINCNSGPTVVHCSTGTGRTGVFLALDICMREYEDSRSVDVLQCVTQLRRERGGAVQNKDQYILIYEAIVEFASRIANQSQRPSIQSSN